eukprot:SAG31_NODE_17523_length_667_cov_1.401408_1_plen_21_part_10
MPVRLTACLMVSPGIRTLLPC